MLYSCSDDKTIRIWNLDTGENVSTIEAHDDRVYALCILKDGNFASGSRDGIVKIWDQKTKKMLMKIKAHDTYIYSVCVLKDGSLASGKIYNNVRDILIQGV
jgi:WD40 repeat protein